MKPLRLSACLIVSMTAGAQVGNFVQFDYPPNLSPPTVPTGCSGSSNWTQQIAEGWKLYCPTQSPAYWNSGTIYGGGSGACQSAIASIFPCNDPNGQIAPTFTHNAHLAGSTWAIYEQIGNASLTLLGAPPFAWYACAPPSSTQGGVVYASNPSVCQCNPGDPSCKWTSPIVIDVTGEGFFMTDLAHGVAIKKGPDSATATRMAWTDPAHHNAWLVRPNADGSVTSISGNMFGNVSPQPQSSSPNGYAALAYWASQEGCGALKKLDKSCSVWPELRLWHDANQNGVVDSGELRTLDEAGITAIGLGDHLSKYVDQFGNLFEYRAQIWDMAGNSNNRSYDVFLVIN